MVAQDSTSLSQIGQIALPVRDVEEATAFYRDQLGLPFLFSAPPGLAFFDCAGVRLMLSAPEGGAPSQSGAVLYFKVDSIDAAYHRLRARGVPFEDEPHIIARMASYDLWMAFFRDPSGNLFGIMAEQPRGS
jgi:methylmalonyl-CoA/ethylmalonyl-CoA epimerase